MKFPDYTKVFQAAKCYADEELQKDHTQLNGQPYGRLALEEINVR